MMRVATITAMCLLLSTLTAAAMRESRLVPALPVDVSQSAPAANVNDSIAVTGFTNITGLTEDNWIGTGIAETLRAAFEGVGFSVVGPQVVSRILERRGGGQDSSADGGAMDAGRLLGTRWVISGGYQRLGNRMRITARVMEVVTATVVQTAIVDGNVSELFTLQDQLAAELRHGLLGGDAVGVTVAPTSSEPVSTVVEPPPPTDVNVSAASNGRAPAAQALPFIDGPPAPVPPEIITRDALGRATVRAVRLTGAWQLDGVLDEAIYTEIPPLTGFVQQTPNEGEPATERTEAWVFYDDQHMYVSARLWDSAPESQWVTNTMQRDSSQLVANDTFTLVFDTFYDRRNGVGFMVNPIGGFFDYELSDESKGNPDWNPIWDVKTGRFDGGWTTEFQIPFKSIRFKSGTEQIWGLQLGRVIQYKNELAYLTPIPISAGRGEFRLSAAATLTGVQVPEGNRTFEIKPYAIGSLATDVNAVPLVSNQPDGAIGVDVKYGITPNLTADFTYNTDFAQVEVDEQQVNLTRFSLFFREKRDFFLERQGIFEFGGGVRVVRGPGGGGSGRNPGAGYRGSGDVPTIFFSRRIGLSGGRTVPILGGGRLTGKVGEFSIGAVNVQTGDEPTVGALSTNFTALRVKRDILRRSSIGVIATGRSVSTVGEGSNEAYGVDAVFSFYDNVNFNGYYARTQTPELEGDDVSYQGAFSYNGDRYGFKLDHLLVGDNFNPEVGFLRRDDFRRTFASARVSPRPASIRAVRQFTLEASLDYIENGAGQVETRLAQVRFNMELENSDQINFDAQANYELLARPFDIASNVTIPVGGYDFRDFFLSYAMGPQHRLSGNFSIQRGEFFGGNMTVMRFSRGRLKVTSKLSIEPSISINQVDLPEGAFTAKLISSRITYTLTPRSFVGGLLQYNSSRDALSVNLRLRWEYQPGSEFFVVYNDQRDTTLGLRRFPLLENRAFVVKFTKLFRF